MNNKSKLKIIKALACRTVQWIADNADDYEDYEINISGELVRISVVEYSDKQDIDILDFIDNGNLNLNKKLKHIKYFSVPKKLRGDVDGELLNVLSYNIFQALSYHTHDLSRFVITGDYEQNNERAKAYTIKLLIEDNMNKFDCGDSDDNHHNSFKI